MAQLDKYDQAYWEIDVLLDWIGKGDRAGLRELEKVAGQGRLQISGRFGALNGKYEALSPREIIPELEYAEKAVRKLDGTYALIRDPEQWIPLYGWWDLRVRADEARNVWPGHTGKLSQGPCLDRSEPDPVFVRKRGRAPNLRNEAIAKIQRAVTDGKYTLEQLTDGSVPFEALATEFGFKRKTFTEALRKFRSAKNLTEQGR